jgi:hypothetical protein
MMSHDDTRFYRDELYRRQKLTPQPFTLTNITEKHHYLGKTNDPIVYDLEKQRHKIITNATNHYGKNLRKEPTIQLLSCIIGALELLAFELSLILHRVKDDPTQEHLEQELNQRNINIVKVKQITQEIMEVLAQ